ncbi:CD209 antigen-like protein A [Engystomops pustulosus]|uniref:CD209 antigen-like protein A n=1 Tax=Engystomops pustulosus TaxID=76066 RepID=UPI003AFB71EC
MGGDLMVIKDQEQQDFINRNLQQPGYWIGLQIDGEKQSWVDGTHYNISLVQVTTQSPGRCVVLSKTGYYKDKCDDNYGWICLKKALQIGPS